MTSQMTSELMSPDFREELEPQETLNIWEFRDNSELIKSEFQEEFRRPSLDSGIKVKRQSG